MIKIIHRKIDIKRDRDYILECHCEINYIIRMQDCCF